MRHTLLLLSLLRAFKIDMIGVQRQISFDNIGGMLEETRLLTSTPRGLRPLNETSDKRFRTANLT
jgi:hypothetical protein